MKKRKTKKEPENAPATFPVEDEPAVADQRERGYYYDDAHGYRKYVPEDNGSEDEGDNEGTV